MFQVLQKESYFIFTDLRVSFIYLEQLIVAVIDTINETGYLHID